MSRPKKAGRILLAKIAISIGNARGVNEVKVVFAGYDG
jgi:hypothetical protein